MEARQNPLCSSLGQTKCASTRAHDTLILVMLQSMLEADNYL